VTFKNGGSAQCLAAKVKLTRYTGSTCSGYGAQVGGSGGWEALSPLAPSQQVIVTFGERGVPSRGSYCYKVGYSAPYNDTDGANHQPQRVVSFD
jgi:hypothetical protein